MRRRGALSEAWSGRAWPFLLLWAVSALKILVVDAFYDLDRVATELRFGFGEKVAAIQATGWPETCDGYCAVADRMPGLPYLVAGIAAVFGNGLTTIMLVKTLALDALVLALAWRLWRVARPPAWTLLALAAVWCGPQFILHSASVDYEEGVTIQLVAALVAAQLLLVAEGARMRLILLNLVLAGALLLTKSSMAPLYFWAIAFVAWRSPRGARLAWSLAGLVPFVAWTAAVSLAAGELRFGSSYDGPNLYRGANDVAAAAYPEVNLDRLFDSDSATLPDGREITLPNLNAAAPDFENEWAWSDHYREKALDWIAEHPGPWARLALRKAWVMGAAIENSPPGNDQRGLVARAGMAWMALMRVLFWGALGALAWAAWRRRVPPAMAAAVVGSLVAYAAPYVVGFAYERHAVVLFLPAALALVAALGRRVSPPGSSGP